MSKLKKDGLYFQQRIHLTVASDYLFRKISLNKLFQEVFPRPLFLYQYGGNNSGQLINNRLRYVHDRVADNAYTEDIDSQTPLTLSQVQAEKLDAQNTDNYQYDEIGNLIKDTKEGITAIEWNVYGKIKSLIKGSMTITYTYDAAGNRISKEVDPASGPTRKTYYVRDATGNVMSVYEEGGLVNDGNLTQSEVHLYGSSRLGIFKPDVDMTSLVATDLYGFERGKKFFELSNHLGNVLVTVTDRKNGVALSSNTALVDYYLTDVASANDYYPFGMTMPGRTSHSDKYRYGFNGKENDNEVKGEGNQQDYGFRIYDPRLGRFLSVDPLTGEYPELTPYQFASNSPIEGIDRDGLEFESYLMRFAFWATARIDQKADEVRGKQNKTIKDNLLLFSNGLVKSTPFGMAHQFSKTQTQLNQLTPEQRKVVKQKMRTDVADLLLSAFKDFTRGQLVPSSALSKVFAPTIAGAIKGDPESIGETIGSGLQLWVPFKTKNGSSYGNLAKTGVGGAEASAAVVGSKSIIEGIEYTRVGRWMSEVEYNAMKSSGKMQEGAGGQTFAATTGPESFRRQAGKGSVYAEFDVPSNSLLSGGTTGWVKTLGSSAGESMKTILKKRGGDLSPEVKNLSDILEKKL